MSWKFRIRKARNSDETEPYIKSALNICEVLFQKTGLKEGKIIKIQLWQKRFLQWRALENQQSPFYVVNEVTLRDQNPSLKFY